MEILGGRAIKGRGAWAGLVVGTVFAVAGPAPRFAVAVLPSGHEFALEVAADDASRPWLHGT
jgi:hypothetical protein